jgi:hypothetical protein
MTPATPSQPELAQLLSGYLQRQAGAHAAGLATCDTAGEVLPYEAGPVQPIDPRLAWDEALTAARCFVPQTAPHAWRVPPSWPTLVAGHEPVASLALCVGNFPQLVRDLHLLLRTTNLADLRPSGARPGTVPGIAEWAAQASQSNQIPQLLLAVGTLRLAKQFDQAAEVLTTHEGGLPAEWRSAWANEQAALAWHRGQAEEASALWQAQAASVPVAFNRGMAALFLGDRPAARTFLAQAVAGLPEDGSWYHLGRLYLALAEARP